MLEHEKVPEVVISPATLRAAGRAPAPTATKLAAAIGASVPTPTNGYAPAPAPPTKSALLPENSTSSTRPPMLSRRSAGSATLHSEIWMRAAGAAVPMPTPSRSVMMADP